MELSYICPQCVHKEDAVGNNGVKTEDKTRTDREKNLTAATHATAHNTQHTR